MPFSYSDISQKANGGTELMCRRLEKVIDSHLLDQFQIIPSRMRDLDPTKYRIFYCHDLPNDPESAHLANGGWKKFHRLVFVSNWQMQSYIATFHIPWSRCVVIENAIDLFDPAPKDNSGPVNLIYHTTPHRGLDILLSVYDSVANDFDVMLDVYSSFGVYGWQQRDVDYEPLFKFCREHPRINYHGSVDNAAVREALTKAHVFAYPCTWPETSCLALIEALGAGCMCIHPNFGALFETSIGCGEMYQWHENKDQHARRFESLLRLCLSIYKTNPQVIEEARIKQIECVEHSFSMSLAKIRWESLMQDIITEAPSKEVDAGEMFSFNTNKR